MPTLQDSQTETATTALEEFFQRNMPRFEEELFEFLRIPSVSTKPEHHPDIARAAEWLKTSMQSIGLNTTIYQTAAHPIVVGEWRGKPGAPTVLVYGHYDVQPAEPLELWDTPPFEPSLRDGKFFARGAADDKGQLFLHLKAIEAHLAVNGSLPVNAIVVAEGQEEIGSPELLRFVALRCEQLKADAIVISDSAMFGPGQPSLLSSLRGISYFQIDVQGARADLHSGMYGGAVANPAAALARILASFHHTNGRIAIPGFYDAVREWEPDILAQMRSLPFDDDRLKSETGVDTLTGESNFTTLERLWTRPTCEVNGLLSGYTGEGAKTVLPAKAMAKVSCRLVPDQDPREVQTLIEEHVRLVAPPGVSVQLRFLSGCKPWRARLEGPLFNAAKSALRSTFGRDPLITGEGGSLPIVPEFERILRAPVLLVGFGLPGENLHAPNEWLSQENFRLGMRAMARLWAEFANASERP